MTVTLCQSLAEEGASMQLITIEPALVVAAAVGSVVGTLLANNTTPKQAVASCAIGFGAGIYITPAIVHQFNAPAAFAQFISFLTGIFAPPILTSVYLWARQYKWGKEVEKRLPGGGLNGDG